MVYPPVRRGWQFQYHATARGTISILDLAGENASLMRGQKLPALILFDALDRGSRADGPLANQEMPGKWVILIPGMPCRWIS